MNETQHFGSIHKDLADKASFAYALSIIRNTLVWISVPFHLTSHPQSDFGWARHPRVLTKPGGSLTTSSLTHDFLGTTS